jgi:hypothetical protein
MNKKTHKNIYTTNNNRKSRKIGGKSISSGSYGCVFRPSLTCENADSNKADDIKKGNFISKLMYNDEDFDTEKQVMDNLNKILGELPDINKKHFLVSNTTTCTPSKFNDEELVDFNNVCDIFSDKNINESNINSNLDKLKIINMPDGGIEVATQIKNIIEINESEIEKKYKSFIKLNNSLITLLSNGIIPINKLNLNHYDIKGNNMLINDDGIVRLIDWGLAIQNDGKNIPDDLKKSIFQFNTLFSNLFFNKDLTSMIPDEYKKIKASELLYNEQSGQTKLLKIVAVNLLNNLMHNNNDGHFNVIKDILHKIYKIYAIENGYNKLDYDILIENTIIDYITAVLIKFVDSNGIFKEDKYFFEVYQKNTDILGFLTVYIRFIEKGIDYSQTIPKKEHSQIYRMDKDIINGICRIIIQYCYSTTYAIKEININKLIKELKSLNKIAESIIKKSTNTTSIPINIYNSDVKHNNSKHNNSKHNKSIKFGFSKRNSVIDDNKFGFSL